MRYVELDRSRNLDPSKTWKIDGRTQTGVQVVLSGGKAIIHVGCYEGFWTLIVVPFSNRRRKRTNCRIGTRVANSIRWARINVWIGCSRIIHDFANLAVSQVSKCSVA